MIHGGMSSCGIISHHYAKVDRIMGMADSRVKIKIALLALVIGTVLAQTDENRPINSEPRDILLADHIHGHWITIGRINHKQPGGEFNPNWTYIRLEAPIKPVVRKRGNVYSITFTTELTEDLP
jgi:hypothetical protein